MAAVTGWPRDGYPFHADELGETFAGLIRRDSNGLPVPGILGDVGIGAVASSWQVRVGPFVFVDRVGTGVRFSGESAESHVDITPAAGSVPAGQARIDVIGWDTDNAVSVVVEGTPATSPVAPTVSGFEPLAQVRVNAGDGQVIASQITRVFARTGLVGGRVAQGVVAKRNVARGTLIRVPVTFPAGMFSEIPVVIPGVFGAERLSSVTVDNVTTSGCDILISNNASVTRQLGATWRAEQL